ncbi:dihydropteroate synthase [Candidatus Micrarchaeota archaeon]|nr:dihydropteroate synthase [Candidatus Micrarchaeota archaeon]
MKFHAKNKVLDLSRPKLMGILNVTPDSFSDGGKFKDLEAAVKHAKQMIQEGAAIIDVGGESTRPGAKAVSMAEEKKRILPVIERLAQETQAMISVDTYKPDVAKAALHAGAHMVNDVTGLTNPEMMDAVSDAKAGAVIMHMQGTPQTMQENPKYQDVVEEVKAFLLMQARQAKKNGIQSILIDPGIGFGKTLEHNLELLANLKQFQFGYPVCIGVSRKSFIGKITGEKASNRLEGTLAAVTACVLNGANVLRVHDVAACQKAVDVAWAIQADSPEDGIRVENLRVKAHVGVLAWEKKSVQDVVVDVHAFLDLKKAVKTDDLKKTLDYRAIVSAAKNAAESRHFNLLESLGEAVADAVKKLGAKRVTVRAVKPSALKNTAQASVQIQR